jgi:hypothetical protein
MASVGVQHRVSTRPGSSSGIRRSSRPVSSPSGVRSPGFVVRVSGGRVIFCPAVRCPPVRCPPGWCPPGWCPAVRCPAVRCPGGCCPPRRSGPSVSSHPGRWRWAQVGAAGIRHHGNGSGPGGLPRRCAARSTAEGAGTRAVLPGSRVGQRGLGWRTWAGLGTAAARARCATSRPGRRAERPWPVAALWHRMRLRREVAAPAAWLPSGLGGDHGGWWPWGLPPGWAGPEGRWACWRDGRAAPARPRLAAGAPGWLPAAL